MYYRYVKANPCGNTTVFILDHVDPSKKSIASKQIMSDLSISAEQVGFFYPSRTQKAVRMEMMGGEFCGNASRSFGAWLAFHKTLIKKNMSPEEDTKILQVEVSGANHPLNVSVKALGGNNFYSEIEMPIPNVEILEDDSCLGNIHIVPFGGIQHLIIKDKNEGSDDPESAFHILHALNLDSSAFGLMYYDTLKKFLKPHVIVRSAGTDVWERSCGSGSCALALVLSLDMSSGTTVHQIAQPGGSLSVTVSKECGHITKILLGGHVSFTSIGKVWLDI